MLKHLKPESFQIENKCISSTISVHFQPVRSFLMPSIANCISMPYFFLFCLTDIGKKEMSVVPWNIEGKS